MCDQEFKKKYILIYLKNKTLQKISCMGTDSEILKSSHDMEF
jgi:hypothetical protein